MEEAAFRSCVTRMFGELWGIPAHSRYWAEPYVPHANPCSMSRADLAALAAGAPGGYTVAPKSDGERCFLLVGLEDAPDGSERVFGVLVSRSYHTLRRLPGMECREYADAALGRAVCEACYGTLLDGELLPPKAKAGPGSSERFVVHDAVAVSGCCMLRERHSARLAAAARVAATLTCGGLDIQFKQWLPLPRVREALAAAVWASADGLIFAPEHAPLTHGKNRQLFKWKPPSSITLDFILTPDRRLVYSDEGREVDAAAAGGFTLLAASLPADLRVPCVVECACEPGMQLRFVRVRYDKTTPNDASTVHATLLNVAENVTEADVVKALDPEEEAEPASKRRCVQ